MNRSYAFIVSLVLSSPAACAAVETIAPDAVGGSRLSIPFDIYNPSSEIAPPADGSAADAAFSGARAAIEARSVSDALRLAVKTLEHDADHEPARRLLGYRRAGQFWVGNYAARMLESGHAWTPDFGWVKSSDVEKFKSGLRPSRGHWVTADVDARQHSAIDRGWTVRTDHVLVTTNIDRAAGASLAVRLEALYQIWRQLFGEFTVTSKELAARLDGNDQPERSRKPFRVYYHRDRHQYNNALRRRQPKIEMTIGIYFDAQRESHFFAGADQDPGTIAHEAVHQFFYESAPHATRRLGAVTNVWAIEGVACYFESLTELEPDAINPRLRSFTIGTPGAGRLQAARHRRVVDEYYVPLAELTSLGLEEFQRRPDIGRLYSQSAGLATFLMQYEGGIYRPAFRRLLAAIYAGRDEQDTLAKATGETYEALDRKYLDYMSSLPVTATIAPEAR